MFICQICKKEFNNIRSLTIHIRIHKISLQQYYDQFLKTNPLENICNHPNCNNPTPFLSLEHGYQKFCSLKCSTSSPETIQKTKQKCIEKYGVDNPMKDETISNKLKTSLSKTFQNKNKKEEITKKRKNTVQKKYNVSGVLSVPEFQQKQINTTLKKYGHSYYSQTDEFKERVKQTSLEKYGKEHFLQNLDIQEKKKTTVQERYGVDEIFQNPIVQQKIKETLLKERGVSHISKDPIIQQKISNNLKKLYKQKGKEIITKREQTMLLRYGVKHPLHYKPFLMKQRQTTLQNFKQKIKEYLLTQNIELIEDNINYTSDNVKFKCLICNHEYTNKWYNIQLGYGKCPKCFPRNMKTSKAQQEIFEFISSMNINVESNVSYLIPPFEIDLWLPDYNLCIEYNGLYWHNENFRASDYHYKKYLLCKEKGFKLLQIFEDEWNYKKEIWKNIIKSHLQKNTQLQSIYARKCIIQEISPKQKNQFLDENHLQGRDYSVIKLGAFYNDELIAVMTFGHGSISRMKTSDETVWELSRFCSLLNYNIPGIASKLLAYFQRHFKWTKIYSYADLRWSQGNLYRILNFQESNFVEPNYWYVDSNYSVRIHRFRLRKQYTEPKDIPEWQLRLNQGYTRIWDVGKIKFEMNIKF